MHNAQEQQRHQYLDAMGIASWLPRVGLPGAAPSADWVFAFRTGQAVIDVDDSAFDADHAVEVDHAAGQNALRQLADLAGGTGVSKGAGVGKGSDTQIKAATASVTTTSVTTASVTTASATPASKPSAQQAETVKSALPLSQDQSSTASTDESAATTPHASHKVEPPPRFRLAFIKAGDMLLVDALPPHARQGFSPLHQRLVQRILQAMDVSEQQGLPQFLSWPMLASKTLNQGPDEARRSVERLLGYQLTPEITRVVLLGEPSARWVLAREEALEQLRGLSFTLKPGVKVVASHSLSELLQLPEFKADLWRDLQPLRLAVTSSEH